MTDTYTPPAGTKDFADALQAHAHWLRAVAGEIDKISHDVMTNPTHAETLRQVIAIAQRHPRLFDDVPNLRSLLFFPSVEPGLQEDAVSALDRFGREDNWPDTAEFLDQVLDEERSRERVRA